MNIKSIGFQIFSITFVSTLCGLIYNAVSDNGISLNYKPLDLETGSYLTLEQTRTLLNEGRTLFIDTRYKNEYEQGHIKGAKNVPGNASREEILAFFESIPKDQQIVTYCSRAECNTSRRAAGFLTYLGYTKVMIYVEGFSEWEANDYPIEK